MGGRREIMKEEEESCEGVSTSSAPATPDARLQQPAAAAPRPAAATASCASLTGWRRRLSRQLSFAMIITPP